MTTVLQTISLVAYRGVSGLLLEGRASITVWRRRRVSPAVMETLVPGDT